jgi:excisionase family DNA binding protein
MDDPLLKIPEAAALLRVGRMTVYRRIASGELPSVDIGTGRPHKSRGTDTRLRVRRSDVEAFLASRTETRSA